MKKKTQNSNENRAKQKKRGKQKKQGREGQGVKGQPSRNPKMLRSRYGGGPQITNMVADIYTATICHRQLSGGSSGSSSMHGTWPFVFL